MGVEVLNVRENYIVRRIEMIEEDLEQLKRFVSGGQGITASLRGLWEGADITEEEIEEPKHSLFKGNGLDDFR